MQRAGRTIALVGTIACSIAGAIAAIEPSMAFRSKHGVIQYTYGLSVVVAPVLWAVMAIVAARALRSPTPRRLAATGITTILAMPFLFGIHVLREPWFDIDNQFVVLSPWAIELYSGCLAVATGISIYLVTMAHRIGVTPSAIPRAAAI
jgi:drug/metabolite transporter (DMT)-like permease